MHCPSCLAGQYVTTARPHNFSHCALGEVFVQDIVLSWATGVQFLYPMKSKKIASVEKEIYIHFQLDDRPIVDSYIFSLLPHLGTLHVLIGIFNLSSHLEEVFVESEVGEYPSFCTSSCLSGFSYPASLLPSCSTLLDYIFIATPAWIFNLLQRLHRKGFNDLWIESILERMPKHCWRVEW